MAQQSSGSSIPDGTLKVDVETGTIIGEPSTSMMGADFTSISSSSPSTPQGLNRKRKYRSDPDDDAVEADFKNPKVDKQNPLFHTEESNNDPPISKRQRKNTEQQEINEDVQEIRDEEAAILSLGKGKQKTHYRLTKQETDVHSTSLVESSILPTDRTETDKAAFVSSSRPERRRKATQELEDERPTKKAKLKFDSTPILTLPFELLAEILILTGSSEYVLSVARTCKSLCRTLLGPDAEYIWREARQGPGCTFVVSNNMATSGVTPNREIMTLPDPPKGFFGEVAYAAFLFDSGNCDICGNITKMPYDSFSLKIRLCKMPTCNKPPASKVTEMPIYVPQRDKILAALPTSESTRCFRGVQQGIIDIVWPTHQPGWVRIDQMQEVLKMYTKIKNTKTENIGDVEKVRKKLIKLEERTSEWMKFCVELHNWKTVKQAQYRMNRSRNDILTKQFATNYGWELDDLLITSAFKAYKKQKNNFIEKLNDVDIRLMKDRIEDEIIRLNEKRGRSRAEVSLMNNRRDIKDYYHRLCTGKVYPFLPSLETFRRLPVISMLQSSDNTSTTSKTAIKSLAATLKHDSTVKELLDSQIKKWIESAKLDMLGVLGFSKTWKNASKNILHPVERVTARFLCKECNRLDVKYRIDGCLDFAGVCIHECGVGSQKRGRIKKGKKAVWNPQNFVKDEKSIKVLKKIIQAFGYEEEKDAGNYVVRLGLAVICKSCDKDIVLDSRNVLGHCHRHEDMEIALPSQETAILYLGGYPYEYGLAQSLLDPECLSTAGKKECERKNFGCRHCMRQRQGSDILHPPSSINSSNTPTTHIQLKTLALRMHDVGVEGPYEKPPTLYTFHGMRSHLKGKHHLQDIRDEDFFCYKSVEYVY